MNRRIVQLALVGAIALLVSAQADANVHYLGGRIMPKVRIIPIFYGASWTFADISDTFTYVNELVSYINGGKNPSGKQTVYAQYGVTAANTLGINWVQDPNTRQLQLPGDPEIFDIIHAFQEQTQNSYGPDKLYLLLPGPGYSLPLLDPCGFHDREGGSDSKYYAVLPRDCPTFKHHLSYHVLATATAPNFDGWQTPLSSCFGHKVNFGAGDIALPWDNIAGGCVDNGFDNAMGETLQVVGTDVTGGLFHLAKRATGLNLWTPFGDVKVATGTNPGIMSGADIQETFGVLTHVVARGPQGRLWHSIRTDEGWTPLGDVNSATGAGSLDFARVALANVGGDLHVCATTTGGGVQHAIRYQGGFWSGFGDVLGQTGPAGSNVLDVDCAGDGVDMHIVMVTSAGKVFHAIRHPNSWTTPLTDVETKAGQIGNPTQVSIAVVAGQLNVTATVQGTQFHTIRTNPAAETWQAFAQPPNNIQAQDSDSAATGSSLNLVTIDGGVVKHRVRTSAWSPFIVNVNTAAGNSPGQANSLGTTKALGF